MRTAYTPALGGDRSIGAPIRFCKKKIGRGAAAESQRSVVRTFFFLEAAPGFVLAPRRSLSALSEKKKAGVARSSLDRAHVTAVAGREHLLLLYIRKIDMRMDLRMGPMYRHVHRLHMDAHVTAVGR